MAPRLVFVADLDRPVLDDEDDHHLRRVVRLRPGEELHLGDGVGGWRPARWAGSGPEPTGDITRTPAPVAPVGVAFAPVKADRPEWTVQKLTELGVVDIRPFIARRSVVRWPPERAARQVARWQRVAREAAAQSHRFWLPMVHPVVDFAGVAALPGAVRADRGGRRLGSADRTVLVGPEGGWAPEEVERLPDAVGLSDAVLRAETAALTAAVLLRAVG